MDTIHFIEAISKDGDLWWLIRGVDWCNYLVLDA
jgi:hypothetical protein